MQPSVTLPVNSRRPRLRSGSKQAVLDTTAGPIVMDLLADKAPNHVALFIKTAESGGYDGTTFFRMIKYGIVQGGDPVTKDPDARGEVRDRRPQPVEARDDG